MSPEGQIKKPAAMSNVYTVVLALAVLVVIATAGLVAYKCYFQYGTLFKIP
jgi:hypothetical protein